MCSSGLVEIGGCSAVPRPRPTTWSDKGTSLCLQCAIAVLLMRMFTPQAAVREARLRELKAELLNSDRLKAHFEDNPHEFALLKVKHDRSLRSHRALPHLAHLPSYLMPNAPTVQLALPGRVRGVVVCA